MTIGKFVLLYTHIEVGVCIMASKATVQYKVDGDPDVGIKPHYHDLVLDIDGYDEADAANLVHCVSKTVAECLREYHELRVDILAIVVE